MEAEDLIERLIRREAKEQLRVQAEEYEEKLREKEDELKFQALEFEKRIAALEKMLKNK